MYHLHEYIQIGFLFLFLSSFYVDKSEKQNKKDSRTVVQESITFSLTAP